MIYEPEHLRRRSVCCRPVNTSFISLVDRVETLVFESGEGGGEAVSESIPGSAWESGLFPPGAQLLSSAYGAYWGLILVSALLDVAGAGFGMMFLFGKKVAQDISSWPRCRKFAGHGVISGPRTKFTLTRHAMDVCNNCAIVGLLLKSTLPKDATDQWAAPPSPPDEEMPSSPAIARRRKRR